ncbi:aspartyl protease family protein [Aridibaculum aurantiacum]|uniref:aspartyl protease family protein n=1 Tax=Aridibaculum aurantiacum TaxID=2810307 RepID=UPI001A967F1A|nr:pepsin/retropepsin-like aspartic protease family protein [Aridibaculum aurantiacum]
MMLLAHAALADPGKPLPTSPVYKIKNTEIEVNYTPDPRNRTDSTGNIIPFTKVGNLIIIKATVDTIQGNFILDTGAPHLVLNQTYFRHYTTSTDPDMMQTGITGVGAGIAKATIKMLQVGSFDYAKCEADLISLGHLENSKGIRILGLLGMSLFRQCEMMIDYENSVIRLCYINRRGARNFKSELFNGTDTYTEVPIEMLDSRITVSTEMAGKNLKFIIDSGAETNILDNKLPGKVMDNFVITGRVMLAGTGNKKVEAVSGDLAEMKIGPVSIGTLPVVITNLEKTCFFYGGCINGILGFEYLSLRKLAFNFVSNKMYIWK